MRTALERLVATLILIDEKGKESVDLEAGEGLELIDRLWWDIDEVERRLGPGSLNSLKQSLVWTFQDAIASPEGDHIKGLDSIKRAFEKSIAKGKADAVSSRKVFQQLDKQIEAEKEKRKLSH